MDLMSAANAADALLAAQGSRSTVRCDPTGVLVNDEVFVFPRDPAPFDNQMLVVHRSTGVAELVIAPPHLPVPFTDLVYVDELDDLGDIVDLGR